MDSNWSSLQQSSTPVISRQVQWTHHSSARNEFGFHDDCHPAFASYASKLQVSRDVVSIDVSKKLWSKEELVYLACD
jgi:hypothetical protein